MLKNAFRTFLLLCSFLLLGTVVHAQIVTQIWSDYNTFWTSSSSSINTVKPDNSHNLLAFTAGSTTYSTGVNDSRLTSNGVSFSPQVYKAFPINSVPSGPVVSYFAGFGQLYDGIDNGLKSPASDLFPATSEYLASLLTDGTNGLNLGTGLANIPSGSVLTFTMGTNGISASSINDGIPDLIFVEIATASAAGDKLKFVDAGGNTVGLEYSFVMNNFTNFPKVAEWLPDFYPLGSSATIVKSMRPVSVLAIDLASMGITNANYTQATKLIYTTSGEADPAFIAYREQSINIASKLGVTAQPSTFTHNTVFPSSITVQVQDATSAALSQFNTPVTASIASGSGTLSGTLTRYTNPSGVATFNDLKLNGGGVHTLKFVSSGLTDATSSNITGPDIQASVSSLPSFTFTPGTASASQSFSVSGTNLGGNITLVAPTHFEVSQTEASGYAGSLLLTQTGGSVSSTTIYTRVASTASGSPTGSISFSSAGAYSPSVSLSTVNTLPLVWVGFNTQVIGGQVLLDWITAAEQQTHSFTVEHGTDGRIWKVAGEVPAAGNSIGQRSYRFVHASPVIGRNYYRIRQTDLDGSYAFSPLKSVVWSSGSAFNLFPNPAMQNGSVQIHSTTPQLIQLMDASGREWIRKTIAAGVLTISLQDLPRGLYFLKGVDRIDRLIIQ